MRITSSIEYATRLMVTLAVEHGRAPMPAEKLSTIDNIPADYVSQILVKLRRAGLVTSRRGSAGGYVLARVPGEIRLAQVIRAVDGNVFEDVCHRYDEGTRDCRHQGQCAISPVWVRLGEMVTGYFESVTLASILEQNAGTCGAQPAWLAEMAGDDARRRKSL